MQSDSVQLREGGGETIKSLRSSIDWGVVIVGGLALLFFLYSYEINFERPGYSSPYGWFIPGGADQRAYWLMAHHLASFNLPHELFLYGPGYPIVGMPAIWLGFGDDPFVWFSAVAFTFVGAATYVVGRRWFDPVVGVLAAFGVIFASGLDQLVVMPWNSTVSLVAIMAVLLLATAPRQRASYPLLMGVMAGWAFDTRYVDMIWVLIVAAVAVWISKKTNRQRVKPLVLLGASTLIVALPVLILQWRYFGSPLHTPYAARQVAGGNEQTLAAFNILHVPTNFFANYVSPYLLGLGQPGQPIMSRFFWVILALPGLWLALRQRSRWLPVIEAFAVACVLANVFYLSFHAMEPGAVQFQPTHYVKMWWPGLAILAAAALVKGTTRYIIPPKQP